MGSLSQIKEAPSKHFQETECHHPTVIHPLENDELQIALLPDHEEFNPAVNLFSASRGFRIVVCDHGVEVFDKSNRLLFAKHDF